MSLVMGVDSSTQSCKVVIVDAATREIVREGRASHPDGTSVDPAAWWTALQSAIAEAGGLDDVEAWAIGGQDAVSDNWVGVSVVLGLFSGLAGAFLALVTAVVAGVQGEPWGRLLLPLLTFPGVVLVVVLMEAFVFE